jgi:hypothetical protein
MPDYIKPKISMYIWCKFASRVKAESRKRKRACVWPVPVADGYTAIAAMETVICSTAFCQCSLLVVLCCSSEYT